MITNDNLNSLKISFHESDDKIEPLGNKIIQGYLNNFEK